MASIPVLLRRLRRARRERESEESDFEAYEADYRELLNAAERVGGESALDAIAEWAVEWTEDNGRLPPPEVLGQHASKLLDDRGLDQPPELQ